MAEEFAATEFAVAFSKFLNNFSSQPQKVAAKKLANEHRTLQQCAMRFFLLFVEEMANNGSDGRNEASVNLAKEIMKIEPNKRYLPFV